MADLDNLRPEVREAVDAFDIGARVGMTFGNKTWNTIRAELLRLAGNYNVANLSAQTWEAKYWAMRERAERAEAELAALKARIAEAPVATLVISSAAGDLTLVWAENPDDWASKRVRLLVEE